ncbi:hypothetical protein P691DRAFT_775441 [Macrolepiota fuliginosa MF-IS2]|uniref:F-box domain-containing protein n=1 Tax=Macrolepiota fuliginosa MF-IS2 TaxID=1400762 RepID=A0A9P5XE00_9AGAR|nr:hypothetical protein P691DRAFT_775441 [Macrolepiota fuliginosa MF-IS2]
MIQEIRATLIDLPVEIFDLIVDELDSRSFLTLARVSRALGQIVLQRMVPATTIDHINFHSELIIGPGAPVTILPAVAASLWTPKITAITYSVQRNEEGHFLDDIRGLSIILFRLPPGSLKSLKVKVAFGHPRPTGRQQLDVSDRGNFQKILGRLLSVAVSIACSRIEISNGRFRIDGGYSISMQCDGSNVFSRLWDDVKFRFRQFHYRTPPPTTLGTRILILETPLFFIDGEFMRRTIKDLRRASRTIQHLTISLPHSHDHGPSGEMMWGFFRLSVRLPHLTSLVLKSRNDTKMSWSILSEFLSHLPNVTSLTLDFSPRLGSRRTPGFIDQKRHLILPKLESLEAHPAFFPWLLPLITHIRKWDLFLPRARGGRRL